MGVSRPGVWRFIYRLAEAFRVYEHHSAEFLAGADVRKKSKPDQTKDEKLKKLMAEVESSPPKAYLYAIVKAITE